MEIIRCRRKTIEIQIKPDGRVVVRAPQWASTMAIEEFVASKKDWIDKQLAKQQQGNAGFTEENKLSADDLKRIVKQAHVYIPERVQYYAGLLGVSYGRVAIRSQRTRWGSCSADGNLNFNCMLMLTPPEVVDSVVVHELCHRKEMNHSKRFYDEIYRVYPDYDEWNKWLKKHGDEIMRML